jgi:hypothetical protein
MSAGVVGYVEDSLALQPVRACRACRGHGQGGVGDRFGRPLRHLADGTGQDKYVVHVRPDE